MSATSPTNFNRLAGLPDERAFQLKMVRTSSTSSHTLSLAFDHGRGGTRPYLRTVKNLPTTEYHALDLEISNLRTVAPVACAADSPAHRSVSPRIQCGRAFDGERP